MDRTCGDDDTGDGDPLWDAYTATLNVCSTTPATTLVGLIAKARIAELEMPTRADDAQAALADPAERLAQSIVDDLLRIARAA